MNLRTRMIIGLPLLILDEMFVHSPLNKRKIEGLRYRNGTKPGLDIWARRRIPDLYDLVVWLPGLVYNTRIKSDK